MFVFIKSLLFYVIHLEYFQRDKLLFKESKMVGIYIVFVLTQY